MDNNDVLRRLRYALDISDTEVAELFRLGGREVAAAELAGFFQREGEPDRVECGDGLLRAFLDGLVLRRRGPREAAPADGVSPGAAPPARGRLTNNDILKSLRIALELRDEDLVAIMGLAGVELGSTELSALFRKPGHPKYRACGDQFLRNFLAGLTRRLRG